MKTMRAWKKLATVMLIVSLITGTVPMKNAEVLHAEESLNAETIEELQGGISLQQDTVLDLSDVSFQMTDIRDASKVSTFNGADGKQAIIIFGGVGECLNTQMVLRNMTQLVSNVDMSKLNIYYFEISGTSEEKMINNLGSVSEQITANRIENDPVYNNLFFMCYRAMPFTTMPLIVYKGTDGSVYSYTSGAQDMDAIVENVRAGGLDVSIGKTAIQLNVTGTELYDEAYQVLELINQERAKEGLGALNMDAELQQAAMLRAAECSLLFDHTRPSGLRCFSASSKMRAENIARGYRSAVDVMEGWMNSTGHRANILWTDAKSVGVGAVEINGQRIWTQCFGVETGNGQIQNGNREEKYHLECDTMCVEPLLSESSGNLRAGDTRQLTVQVINGYSYSSIDADSYQWESDSDVATVSSDGVITALSPGSVVITGRNVMNPSQTLTYTLTVKDKTGTGDANGDGQINSKDVVMIKQYMAGYTNLRIDISACDVNVDGKVDSKDVVKILRKLAGYDVTLGEK